MENKFLRCCFCQQILVGFEALKKHKLTLHVKELEVKRAIKKKNKNLNSGIHESKTEDTAIVAAATESKISSEEQQRIDSASASIQPLPQHDLQETQDTTEENNRDSSVPGPSENSAGSMPVLRNELEYSVGELIPPKDEEDDDINDIPPAIDECNWDTRSEGSVSSRNTVLVPPLCSSSSIKMEKCSLHNKYTCCCEESIGRLYKCLKYLYIKETLILSSPDKEGSKEDDGANDKENDAEDILAQLPEGSKEAFTEEYVNNLNENNSTQSASRTTIYPAGILKRKKPAETQVKDTQNIQSESSQSSAFGKKSKLDNYSVTPNIGPESVKLRITFPSNPSPDHKSKKNLRSFKCSIDDCKFRNRSRSKWIKHTKSHIQEIEVNGKSLEPIYNGHIDTYSGRLRQIKLHRNSDSYFRCTHCPPPGELFSTRLHLENHLLSAIETGEDLGCWECEGWHTRLVRGFLKHEAEVHGMDELIF